MARRCLGLQCCEGHGDAINDISVHPTKPTLVLTASRVRTDLCRASKLGSLRSRVDKSPTTATYSVWQHMRHA